MNRKGITLAFLAFMIGLGVCAIAAESGHQAGVKAVVAVEPAEKACADGFAQWADKWGLVTTDDRGRASVWLYYGGLKMKVNTLGGGKVEGSFIDEYGCNGGDVRGLFTAPGEFALVFFNFERYDYRCGFVAKGALDLPPPLPFVGINEIGLGTGTGTLELGGPGVWFHESVNDYLVQDWVAVDPTWAVNSSWLPSPTYDMNGTGSVGLNLTYFGARTYPRPAHNGFQYEVCLRKNSGDPTYNMALYFNGDGTLDNCVIAGITAVDGYYSVFEISGGTSYTLIPWTPYEPNLFVDDLNVTGENVFNMVKANVRDDGSIDIYINEQYVASTQALYNFSGYVGLAIADSPYEDRVSCDNMTLSTIALTKGSIADRKFRCDGKIVDPRTALSAK